MHLLFLTKSVNTLTLLEAAEKVHLYIFAFHEGEGEGEGTMNWPLHASQACITIKGPATV